MSTEQQMHHNTDCRSEYDPLKRVIVCEPHYMTIRDVINDTQKHFKNVGIHIEKAVEQHTEFVKVMRCHEIEVVLLPYHKKVPRTGFYT